MATTDDPLEKKLRPQRQRPWPRRDGLFRFSVDQLYQLDELGFFDDRRVELIEGVLYEMTSKPVHCLATELTELALRGAFGPGYRIRTGQPLDTGRRSLAEPDLAVVAGGIRDAGLTHPTTAELVVEISNSTLRKDRTLKVHLYAHAGIADYWIVNLVDRQLEVHRGPGSDPARKGRFGYRDVTIVSETGNMAPLAAPGSPIAVADLLP